MLFEPLYKKYKNSKVNWQTLSLNRNAIPILEKNLDKIDWRTLSFNKNAIHLL